MSEIVLPTHASVVVIGGGVMGCSTLHHLAEAAEHLAKGRTRRVAIDIAGIRAAGSAGFEAAFDPEGRRMRSSAVETRR